MSLRLLFLSAVCLCCSVSLPAQTSGKQGSSSSSRKEGAMEESIRRAREQQAIYESARSADPNAKPFARTGTELPAFQVVTVDEKAVFDTDLPKGKPVLLLLFNPGCGHCVDVGKALRDSMGKLKNVTLLFVTAQNQIAELPRYVQETGLGGFPNVIIAADNTNLQKYLFEYNGMPQIMVYGKDRVLQKTFYKYASTDSLLHYLKIK